MRAVWKFPLLKRIWGVAVPKGAKVLHVHAQIDVMTMNEVVCLWMEVDTDVNVPLERRTFYTEMTGDQFPDDGRLPGVRTVAHVFEA